MRHLVRRETLKTRRGCHWVNDLRVPVSPNARHRHWLRRRRPACQYNSINTRTENHLPASRCYGMKSDVCEYVSLSLPVPPCPLTRTGVKLTPTHLLRHDICGIRPGEEDVTMIRPE
ncbi:hypothetical protein E2C01_066894 [Portunus trituberculatus]|uniref:Uncharacterized protein n=1 Tax=Portunus trituberculatus TaxID=210409 RepID=A0A5B7HMR7_PORTR|nr:hypothetical protein [Portunus trituberculatus]